MITKAAGVVIGVGLISTGGIAMTKPHWLGMDYMPDWKPLSQDTNYKTEKTNSYGEGKFGNKKGNYLTGVTGNESWWEWSFRRLEKDKNSSSPKPGDKFVNAKNYSTSGTDAINKICEDAYKADSSNVDDTGSSTKFKKSDIWKYCSPLGKEPTKVKDVAADQRKYSGKFGDTNKEYLISVEDKDNDLFWDIRDKEVKGKEGFERIPESDTDTHFKTAGATAKDLCKAAYGRNDISSTTTPSDTNVKKYCGLTIS